MSVDEFAVVLVCDLPVVIVELNAVVFVSREYTTFWAG
jgi:hypothetical protein